MLIALLYCPTIALSYKVFLRKNAHDFLEMLRTRRIAEAAVTLQRVARGFVYRRVFFATKHAVVLIQRMSRGMTVSGVQLVLYRDSGDGLVGAIGVLIG